jgi:hypothetical protein
VVDSGDVGRSAVYITGIIITLGHCLNVRQHGLGTLLYSQFQLLLGNACYLNRILG